MFFFFGVGKSKLKNQHLLKDCACPHCNNQNTLITQTVAKYFHFFFIPIFPVSKETVAVCTHCKINLEETKFNEEMKRSFDAAESLNPNKRPIWHGCGCMVFLIFFGFSIISSIIGYFTMKHESGNHESTMGNLDIYLHDLDSLTVNPKLKNDTISLIAKDCLDSSLDGIVNTDNIEYYSKSKEDKILIILKISDIKKIQSSTRKEILNYIKDCLSEHEAFDDKKIYIAVEGQWNTVLVSTPKESDDDGKYASTKLLDGFYKDDVKTIDTVNIKIKKDKK